MKLNPLSTVSFSAMVIAGALIAPQVLARGPGHLFEKFDENQDGTVTRTEAHQKVLEHFKKVDANKDRVVTEAEAKTHRDAKMKERGNPEAFIEAHFRSQDTNKNGKIERGESRLLSKIFDRIDKNSDGSITKEEALESHRARMAKHSKRHGDSPSKGHENDRKAHGSKKSDRRPHGSPFAGIDTSGDGKITEAEAKGAVDRVFSRIDQNQDNVVTRAEVVQMKKDHHPGPRGKGHDKKQK